MIKKKAAKRSAKSKKALKKVAKKKIVKKPAKKIVRKPVAKKAVKVKALKPIGRVTHFYTSIKVAIVKFKQPIRLGSSIQLKGATTDFVQKIESLQFDHKPLRLAPKNKLIGLKVKKRVREGDLVYRP